MKLEYKFFCLQRKRNSLDSFWPFVEFQALNTTAAHNLTPKAIKTNDAQCLKFNSPKRCLSRQNSTLVKIFIILVGFDNTTEHSFLDNFPVSPCPLGSPRYKYLFWCKFENNTGKFSSYLFAAFSTKCKLPEPHKLQIFKFKSILSNYYE